MHKEIMFIANPSNEGNGIHSARDTHPYTLQRRKVRKHFKYQGYTSYFYNVGPSLSNLSSEEDSK